MQCVLEPHDCNMTLVGRWHGMPWSTA